MPGSTQNYTSAGTLRGVGIAMIAIASVFFVSRAAARFHQRGWRLQAEDLLVALAYVFFLAMSIAYMVVIGPVYRLAALQNGEIQPYSSLLRDADLVTKTFFCTTMLLWLCLWSVKLAFLMLYRRLMKGLPLYLRWWWGILIFTILVCLSHRCTYQMSTENRLIAASDIHRRPDLKLPLVRKLHRMVHARCVRLSSRSDCSNCEPVLCLCS